MKRAINEQAEKMLRNILSSGGITVISLYPDQNIKENATQKLTR